jgi:hypothetical protein
MTLAEQPGVAETLEEKVDRLMTEGFIGAAGAARLLGKFRGDRPVHPSTIVRLLHDGRLEGIRVNGKWRTTRQAIVRLIAAQNGTAGVTVAPPRPPATRTKSSERAAAELERRGA